MEEENIILSHWLVQKGIFTENLTICRKRPTKNSVHELRVSVKKLRGYLRLNEQITGDKWKESFSKIAELYRSIGRQSDFEVSISLLKKHERKENLSLPNFKDYLSVNRSLIRKWVRQDAIRFNEGEQAVFDQQFNLNLTNAEITEKVIHLSTSKIKKVQSLSRHFHNNAHKIRKLLKDVYHWIRICPEELVESFIRIKSLDQMLKLLGSWQDLSVLKKKITIYKKTLSKNEEKETLQELDKNLANTQDEILDKAIKKWRKIEIKN